MEWLIAGEVVFGILIGLLTGLSKSAVVGTTLPLLFAFGGGSVVELSVGDSITAEIRNLLGQQLFAFSLSVIVGLAIGLWLRSKDIELPFSGRLRQRSG